MNTAYHPVRKCNQINGLFSGPGSLGLWIVAESSETGQGGMVAEGSPAFCFPESRK